MKKLNLGCGKKIKPGFMNVDIQKSPGIDKSFNFDKFPYPFKNNTFDYVLIDNVLEHLENPERVLLELHRICKNGAVIRIIVPYWNSKPAFNLEHKHFFHERSLELLLGVEHSYKDVKVKKFEIKEMKLLPVRLFSFIPAFIRNKLSNYICNVIQAIDAKIIVLK